jgi:hypothetical protein
MVSYDKDKANPAWSTDVWTNPGSSYTLRANSYTVPAGKYYVQLAATVQTGGTVGTWYFDDLYMAKVNKQAPVTIKNSVDGANTLQVQNAAGTSIFSVNTTSSWYSGFTNYMSIGGSAGGSSCGSTGCPVITLNSGAGNGNRWGIGFDNNADMKFMTENGTTSTTRLSLSRTANLTVAGTNACTIGSGTGTTSCTSDIRLKNVEGVATDNLSKIMQLQPTLYAWKSDATNRQRLGLIAQNVQSVLPQFINTGEDGYLQLDYSGLVVPVIGAIQEQQSQINAINSQVVNLQSASLLDGGTITGDIHIAANLTVDGNVTIAGAVHTGDIYVSGHIVTKGAVPTVLQGVALGVLGASTHTPSAAVDGTDAAGTITATTGGESLASGVIAHVTFAKPYTQTYKTVVSASNDQAAGLRVYTVKTATGFNIVSRDTLTVNTQYNFDYIVVGAQN